MRTPQSFVMFLRRRYRVYYCSQAGCWYVAYNDGQRRRVSLGVGTRPEAEAAVRAIDSPPEVVAVVKAERLSWEQAQTTFLSHKESLGKAPRTLDRYKSALNAFGRYLRSLKLQYLDEISVIVLEGYNAFRTRKEKCDVKTAYNDALVIKGLFKWAAKPSRGFLKVNPALDWETPEPVKPKRFCYTAEHVRALDWLRPVVTALAWSGMRIGELVNLRWKDVDFEARMIHIRIREDWMPKGRRDRAIPMHPKVEAVLRSRAVGEFVFLGPRSGRIKETYALHCLKKDQRELKMPEADLHGFRRFFATTMMRAGVDAETVRQWGGWKTLDTMLRYLADVTEKDSIKAMDEAVRKLAAS
jgi:integrase